MRRLLDKSRREIEAARLAQAEADFEYERYLLRSLMDNVPDSIYFNGYQDRFLMRRKLPDKAFNYNTRFWRTSMNAA